MDRDPGDVVVLHLHLACLHATADLQPQAPHRVARGHGAPDRPGRTVEDGEEPVTCGVHLPSPEPLELNPDDGSMGIEAVVPRPVTHRRGQLGGTDDVGEQHRGQDPLGPRDGAHAGQELLDLGGERLRVAHEGQVVVARKLHQAGAGDSRRDVAP